jgi:hypothetical protein
MIAARRICHLGVTRRGSRGDASPYRLGGDDEFQNENQFDGDWLILPICGFQKRT